LPNNLNLEVNLFYKLEFQSWIQSWTPCIFSPNISTEQFYATVGERESNGLIPKTGGEWSYTVNLPDRDIMDLACFANLTVKQIFTLLLLLVVIHYVLYQTHKNILLCKTIKQVFF
jgi:hypothetical protein